MNDTFKLHLCAWTISLSFIFLNGLAAFIGTVLLLAAAFILSVASCRILKKVHDEYGEEDDLFDEPGNERRKP